ncbi:hypothetical protein [Flavobacterium sp.]|uniref:hypothetical protein n=1 Tax=Flavobacterium sp. TaxID=239 RepID=UPI003752C674
MKKRLEAELMSIAHRVLKLKNKSEIDQLYLETQKLYETLTVLKFYGDNYDQVKATVPREELEEKLAASLEIKTPEIAKEKTETVLEPIVVEEQKEAIEDKVEQEIVTSLEESEVQEEAVADEPIAEEEPVIVGEINENDEEVPVGEAKDDLDFEPIFELTTETPIEVEEPKKEQKQISFEDLLGENYSEPVFVKPNDISIASSKKEIFEEKSETIIEDKKENTISLNEKTSTGINIGLNDRVGFVKYLFANSSEDFNRVLSQLNTFDTFSDAKNFITEMIKPDYENWKGQEDYEERFMELVERKFS